MKSKLLFLPLLLGAVSCSYFVPFPEKLVSFDNKVRERALNQLAVMSTEKQTELVKPMIDYLSRPESRVANRAMDALIIIGAPAVPAVREALKSPDVYVRLSAASILEQLGPQAQVTVPDLIVLLQDEHPLAREQAAYTLGAIGPVAGGEAKTPLQKAAHDPDNLVRTAVSDALRKIGIASQPKRFS